MAELILLRVPCVSQRARGFTCRVSQNSHPHLVGWGGVGSVVISMF